MLLRVAMLMCVLASSTALIEIDEDCINYTVYPVQYEITITPYIYKEELSYYNCEVLITVIANAPNVNIIELDATTFDIQTLNVFDGGRDIINVYRPYVYNTTTGKLYIYLQEPLKQYSVHNKKYNIKITFRKNLGSDSTGIFIVPYDNGKTEYMLVTRLSPNRAKFFFPCFDNPRFEAVFKFKVYIIPASVGVEYFNNSLVIAKEMRRHHLKDNNILIEYVPSPQVALYQVGFHYSQFGYRQVKARNTNDTIVIWAPTTKLQNYDYILRFSETILNLIHEYSTVNRPLTYGPINVIAVPHVIDGYETGSWNLLSNGETRLSLMPQLTSVKQRERMVFELTQQLCRIWLGNPGEQQRTRWKEEWFKEGVATYLAYYLLAQYEHGEYSMGQRWPLGIYGLHMKHKAMAEDWHHSTPALATFNRTLAIEIPFRYKELVTMKTAAMLWMIEDWLGSEKFHAALVKYINTRRGTFISWDNFLMNLDLDTVECQHQFFNGSTSSRILNSWFHQSGYPVISVNVLRDRTPNAIQLKQHKFSFTHDSRVDSHYLIPISYIVQNKENCFNCFQLKFTMDQTYTFTENLNGGWIILNRNASGYYRVNYDAVTWKLIAKTLKENRMSIHEQNRAQIVNDVFALYAAGEMNHALAVQVLDYLDDELSPVVWDSVISGFDLLKTDKAACGMTKYLYKEWLDFMGNKVSNIYRRVSGEIEHDRMTRLFRSSIIEFACSIHHKPCLQDLRNMYNEFSYGKKRMDPDSRGACYYMIYQSNGNFGKHGFNAYEVEDKIVAEHKMARENKFQYRIPVGSPIMDRIVMSTPDPIITPVTDNKNQFQTPVPAPLGGRAPASNLASAITTVLVLTIVAVIR